MSDNKRMIRVSVPSEKYEEIWDEGRYDRNYKKLKNDYPDAVAEEATLIGYNVKSKSQQYDSDWDTERYDNNFESLKEKVKDAEALPLYSYSPIKDPATSSSGMAKMLGKAQVNEPAENKSPLGNVTGAINQETGAINQETMPNYPALSDDAGANQSGDLLKSDMQAEITSPAIQKVSTVNAAKKKEESVVDKQVADAKDSVESSLANKGFQPFGEFLYDAKRDYVEPEKKEKPSAETEKTNFDMLSGELSSLDNDIVKRQNELEKQANELEAMRGSVNLSDKDEVNKYNALLDNFQKEYSDFEGVMNKRGELFASIEGNEYYKATKQRDELNSIDGEIQSLRKKRKTASDSDKEVISRRIKMLKEKKSLLSEQLSKSPYIRMQDENAAKQIDESKAELSRVVEEYTDEEGNSVGDFKFKSISPESFVLDRTQPGFKAYTMSQAANRFLESAQETLRKPYKGDNIAKASWESFKNTIASPSFWSDGVSREDNQVIASIYKKLSENEGKGDASQILDPLEYQTFLAYNEMQFAKMARSCDVSMAYKSTEGLLDMLKFISKEVVVGKMGGNALAKFISGKTEKALLRLLINKAPANIIGKTFRALPKAGQFAMQKGVSYIATSLGSAGKALAYVTLTPDAYLQAQELSMPTLDENGKVVENMSEEEALLKSYASTAGMMYAFSGPGKLLRAFSDSARTAGKALNTKFFDRLHSEYVKKLGSHNFSSSSLAYGMSQITTPYAFLKSAVYNQLLGLDENAVANFFDGENFAEMMLPLIPMAVSGFAKTGIGAARYNKFVQQERTRYVYEMNKAANDLLEAGVDRQTIQLIQEAIASSRIKVGGGEANFKENTQALDKLVNRMKAIARESNNDALNGALNGVGKLGIGKNKSDALNRTTKTIIALNNMLESHYRVQSYLGGYNSAVLKSERDAMRKSIEETTGKFHTESRLDSDGKYTKNVVIEGTLIDGTKVFVLNENLETGEILCVREGERKPMFLRREEFAQKDEGLDIQTYSLDEYLTMRVIADVQSKPYEGSRDYDLKGTMKDGRKLLKDGNEVEVRDEGNGVLMLVDAEGNKTPATEQEVSEIQAMQAEQTPYGKAKDELNRLNDVLSRNANSPLMPFEDISEIHIKDDGSMEFSDSLPNEVTVEGHLKDGRYFSFDTTISELNRLTEEIESAPLEDAQLQERYAKGNEVEVIDNGQRIKAMVSYTDADGIEYDRPDGTIGEASWTELSQYPENRNVKKLEGRGEVSERESVENAAEPAAQNDAISGENNPIIAENDRISTERTPIAAEGKEVTKDAEVNIPMLENGDVDYETLIKDNPEEYYRLSVQEFGDKEMALSDLEKRLDDNKKAFASAKLNDRSRLNREIKRLEEAIDKIKQEEKPLEETPVLEEALPKEELPKEEVKEAVSEADAVTDSQPLPVEEIKQEQSVQTSTEGVLESAKKNDAQNTSVLGTVTKSKHTKTGEDIWIVNPTERVSSEDFKSLRSSAKQHGGYYSSFKENKGFIFKTEEDANAFNTENAYKNSTTISPLDTNEIAGGSSETVKSNPNEAEAENTAKWQYELIVDKDGHSVILRDDISGVLPIGDGNFRIEADSPTELKAILQNNGFNDILSELEPILDVKITHFEFRKKADTEGFNGYKIGDKILYKSGDGGKEVPGIVKDFEEFGEHLPVIDTGMGPVIYEVAHLDQIRHAEQSNGLTATQSEKKLVSSQQESISDEEKTARKAFSSAIATDMLAALETGERPYKSIVNLREKARQAGMKVDDEGRDDILIQELVEDGLVKAARFVVEQGLYGGSKSRECYNAICKLYEMQPTIAARSSNRIKMQQYSTPLPMGFVADMFAYYKGKTQTVLEPTAGNGMLVFAVPAQAVHANELDKTRLENLMLQRFGLVTSQDATLPISDGKRIYDAVIANPPFGAAEAKVYDGKEISGLDPQITLNALSNMKDDGKAAIIIGGNLEYGPNGAIKGKKPFITYLYDHYNVKGIVDMDGQLYQRQGTTYPTMMILIDGRRSEAERAQTAVYPPVKENAIRKAETFDDLYDIVTEIISSNDKTNGTEILRSQQGQLLSDIDNAPRNADGTRHTEKPRKDGNSGRGQLTAPDSTNNLLGESGQDNGVSQSGNRPNTGRGPEKPVGGFGDNAAATVEGNIPSANGVGLKAESKTETAPQEKPIQTPVRKDQKPKEKRDLNTDKLPYRPHNTAFSLESVAPATMAEAMDRTLSAIEDEHGSIDEFVRSELGYDTIEDAHNALAAEQIDAVAMSIVQMKKGEALIIGDQTGVGKGRQMASLIRWAVRQGKKPIFITQKADLFSDLYRDMVDVGIGDLRPFIFNSDGAIVDQNKKGKDGKPLVIHKPASSSEQAKVFASGQLPDEYDFAVLTYSQVNTGDAISQQEAEAVAKQNAKETGMRSFGSKKSKSVKNTKPTPKATFLRALAEDNYLLLDESHTAAGSSNTGMYLQSILKTARAATFASATFAKRPDTMPLYAIRTAMSKSKVKTNELITIIENGGVTLQEIMSRALTEAGQMVRRERDMSDVVTDWKTITDPDTVQKARKNYDKTIEAFNDIIKFQQDYVKPRIDDLSASLAVTASSANVKRGTDKMGVENVPFASKTYNYTKQLMLALKVDAIVDEVDTQIKAGLHPVIALESTMESSIKDYSPGEVIPEPTFSASLLKGLDSCMQYTVKDEEGNETHRTFSPQSLGPDAEQAYYELRDKIREATSDIFISPLDAIISKLRAKGYNVGELTGRNSVVEIDDNGRAVVKKRTDKDKKLMQAQFNDGTLDVLILNKSASTGISLHASKKFKDQRQRAMIIAQPLSDINDYMQMIGRIDRTGQVHRGYYINLGLPVPAEQRFLMMLATKLKSLNANTTTAQESESNNVDAPDLLNKYGSQVVIEYLRDNPDIYIKMGEPLKKRGNGITAPVRANELDEYKPDEEDARKITGYVALLNTNEQQAFYDEVVKRYVDLITYLNDIGENDLKITVMPLRAKTLSKKVSSEGIDPNGENPFAKHAYVEEVEMDVLREPMKADEIRKLIDNLYGEIPEDEKGKPFRERFARMQILRSRIEAETEIKLQKEEARYEAAKAKSADDIARNTERINRNQKLSDEDKARAIASYIEDTNDKIEALHRDNVEKINRLQDSFIRRVGMFHPGETYIIPDQLETPSIAFFSHGIFCGLKTGDKKMTPSTTTAIFATNDARRKVEVKLSQFSIINNIHDLTMQNFSQTQEVNLDNWDAQRPNGRRKKGFIMTGNILQAIADTKDKNGNYQGQLISFTDIDGNIRDGILMPDKWNPTQLTTSGVPILARLQEIKSGRLVTSIDNAVSIEGGYKNLFYTLRVPKTKAAGGFIFQNDDIVNLTNRGSGFYQSRGQLQADIPSENIDELVRLLSNLGVKVEGKNEAKQDANLYRSSYNGSGADFEEFDIANIGEGEDSQERFRIREKNAPKKTGIGYKVFVVKNGSLYPPMVANPNGASTPTGVWLDADAAPISGHSKTGRPQVKAGGKGTQGGSGQLAYRPGWHLGEIPYALQFNRKGDLFPKDFVWAEVEYAADRNYQQEAEAEGMTENGKYRHSYAGLKYLPEDGFYIYRTNPNPETDPWIITGAMRVKRILKPSEVDELVRKANRLPQKREQGAFTDEQIDALNAEIESRGNTDYDVMEAKAKELTGVFGVNVRTVRDLNDITDENRTKQSLKRRSNGWYDTYTGEITIVIPNNDSVADVEATILHEVVGHKGLREMFGNDFGTFIDNVYNNVEQPIREQIDKLGREMGYKDSSLATEEYLSRLAERGPLNDAEMSVWRKVKNWIVKQLRKIGFNMKLTEADLRAVLQESADFIRKKYGKKRGAMETASSIYHLENAKEDAIASHSQMPSMETSMKEPKPESEVNDASGNDVLFSMGSKYRELGGVDRQLIDKLDKASYNPWDRLMESVVDKTQIIQKGQQMISEWTGKPMKDKENVSLAIRSMSSKFNNGHDKFMKEVFEPMRKNLYDLEKFIGERLGTKNADEITARMNKYLFLKSGLERQEFMAKREALKLLNERIDKEISMLIPDTEEYPDMLKNLEMIRKQESELIKQGDRTQQDYQVTSEREYAPLRTWFEEFVDPKTNEVLDKLPERMNGESKQSYYARVKKFIKSPEGTLEEIEARAKEYVDDIEGSFGQDKVSALWDSIKKATSQSIETQYKYGLVTKERRDDIVGMYDFYLPMRGFQEETAEDINEYLRRPNGKTYEQTLLAAKGRISKPESPYGYIGSMFDSSLYDGVKNDVFEALYRFVANRPDNGAVKMMKTWYVRDENTGEWKIAEYPELTDNMTREEVGQVMEQFEAEMQSLKLQKLATQDRAKVSMLGGTLGREFEKEANKFEHIVRGYHNGEQYDIIFYGNPRMAQEINGDVDAARSTNVMVRGYEQFLRFFSRCVTSLNPEFAIGTNLQRDALWSVSSQFIQYGLGSIAKLAKNIVPAVQVVGLGVSENAPTTKKTKQYYKEYVEKGGPTGIMQLTNRKEFEKLVKDNFAKDFNYDKKIADTAVKVGKTYMNFLEGFEQIFRLASYMTARESGKTIEASIADAKNITINFDRKGTMNPISWEEAGRIVNRYYDYENARNGISSSVAVNTKKAIVKSLLVAISNTASVAKTLIPFTNAAISAVATQAKYATDKKTAGRFWALAASITGLSLLASILPAMLLSDDDDDKGENKTASKTANEKYKRNDLSMYMRTSKAVLDNPNDLGETSMLWSLPQEFIPFVGLGDAIGRVMIGQYTPEQAFKQGYQTAVENLNPIGLGDVFTNSPFIGTAIAIQRNKNYQGVPISKESDFTKDKPNWTKGTDYTWDALTDLCKVVAFADSGTEYSKPKHKALDWNPANIQYAVTSTLGGVWDFGLTTFNLVTKAVNGEEVSVSDVPIARRWVRSNDKSMTQGGISDNYYYWLDRAQRLSEGRKKLETGGVDNEQADILTSDKDFVLTDILKVYEPIIKQQNDIIKTLKEINAPQSEIRDAYKFRDKIRKDFVDECYKATGGM